MNNLTCRDCHTPELKVVNGKHVIWCKTQGRQALEGNKACDDIDEKIIRPLKRGKHTTAIKIQTRISRYESITYV